MNVLVIPEDFRKDQYLLKPVIQAMMTAIGKPHANIRVCRDPLLGGIRQALNPERIEEILVRYRGMTDLFLLCVDRDGKPGRRGKLDELEALAGTLLPDGKVMFAENAWQEIEVWALAGLDLPRDWNWAEIRQEPDPKEQYFESLARDRGVWGELGEGRKTLAEEAARRYPRIRQFCPEDVAVLETRIRDWLNG